MLDCHAVQAVEDSFLGALDRCSPWSIVHQGKLSEKLSSLIGLQVGLLSIDDLGAVIFAASNNVKSLAFLALRDHLLPRLEFLDGHGIDNNVHVLIGQSVEYDGLGQQTTDYLFHLEGLLDDLGDELLFFVEGPVNFCADSLPAYFFLVLLLLQLLLEFPIGFLLVFLPAAFGVRVSLLLFSFV